MRRSHKEAREIDVEDDPLCDLCGLAITRRRASFHTDEVTIRHECGPSYPEDHDPPTFDADVCGNCFMLEVAPALEQIGLKVVYRDSTGPTSPRPRPLK